ncbi:MAG: hypothetical protein ACRER6_11120, partial [Pseudomonas sp.]
SGVDDSSDSRGVEQPAANGAAESAVFEAAAALPQVLKIVGSFVAPTTLLTALLFYFGWLYAIGFYRYFGVNWTVLDLPVQDYLILSADGLIVPLIITTGAALLALWAHQLRPETLAPGDRRIMIRVLLPFTAIAALSMVGVVIADGVGGPLFPAFLEARGLSLSIGVLLLAYAARLRRLHIAQQQPARPPRLRPAEMVVAEWGALFILVSVGLFWAVGSYALVVGEGRAGQIANSMPWIADAVVYSEKSLSLQAPGVREVACQNPDAAYRFRYEGLKLVPQSGDHYLFLPAGWTPANGAAIVLPRSETLRLEFSAAGQVRSATC